MRRHLNELTVKSLPLAEAGQYDVWCSQLPRFGLRIGTRTKTFILNAGKTRISLGRVGIVTLKHARDEARRRIGAKFLPHTSPEATEAAEWYLNAIQGQKSPTTVRAYEIYLRRLPRLPVHELAPQNLYAALPEGKGAANLCFSTFKAFLSWCVERGHIEANPLLRRRQPNKLQSRDRLLTDEEVRHIWHESFNHGQFGRLMRLSILLGQRTGQWKKYSIQNDLLVFPSSSMKGRAEHVLPVTNNVSNELRTFTHLPQYKQPLELFRKALPHIPDFRPHDARRYISSSMAALRVRQEIVERILAHKTGGAISPIAAVYNRHTYAEETREALHRYEEHLFSSVLTGTDRE